MSQPLRSAAVHRRPRLSGYAHHVADSAIILPDVVLAKAAVDGDRGRGWADALPDMVADLQAMWSLRVDEQLTGGTSAYVAMATTQSGGRAVIKIAVPATTDFPREVRTLELADGRGYVRLLAHDSSRRAMLLEPLGVPLNLTCQTPERQLATVAAVLPHVWSLPLNVDRQGQSCWAGTPVDKAASLEESIVELWQELDQPCPERVLIRAIDCAQKLSRSFAPDRAVVVHGDAATANLLRVPAPRSGADAGFVFVDPSTFVGDPAYDLGVALRDWGTELLAGDAARLARQWCKLLADGGGMDEVAVWQWGYLERVSTGLYAESLGGNGRLHLLTADLLCDVGPDLST